MNVESFEKKEQYVSANKITSQFDISTVTIRRWAEDGKIGFIRPNNSRRLYNIKDVSKFFGIKEPVVIKASVCYARVSSVHQKQDLERQIELLQTKYPENKIYKDIGSGLNYNRSGMLSLLEEVHKGNIGEIIITYKDRLCRFGFEMFQWIFYKHNIKLLVLNSITETTDPSIELSEDLLAITTVFVAKNNGLRSSKYRKERKAKEEKC